MGFHPQRQWVWGLALVAPSLTPMQVWSYRLVLWLCLPADPTVGSRVSPVITRLGCQRVEQKKERNTSANMLMLEACASD